MPKISLSPEAFPEEFAAALRSMRIGKRGRKSCSEATIRQVTFVVGRYLHILQAAGMPLTLSPEGIGLFIDEIDGRGLRASSRLSYLMALKMVAKRMDYPLELMRLISEDLAVYLAEAAQEVPAKHGKLARTPITFAQIARCAVKRGEEAYDTCDSAKRRRLFVRSGLLAFLSLLPMRIGDVSRLIVGQDIIRDQEGWHLRTQAQKNGFEWSTRLHPSLTRFLDRLIHLGEVEAFDALYAARLGSPLFINTKGNATAPSYLSLLFKKETGHTAHIVRSLAHDALAEHGTNGTEIALILCGQKTVAIAKVYEIHARRVRMTLAQNAIVGIQEKLLGEQEEVA